MPPSRIILPGGSEQPKGSPSPAQGVQQTLCSACPHGSPPALGPALGLSLASPPRRPVSCRPPFTVLHGGLGWSSSPAPRSVPKVPGELPAWADKGRVSPFLSAALRVPCRTSTRRWLQGAVTFLEISNMISRISLHCNSFLMLSLEGCLQIMKRHLTEAFWEDETS